MPGATACRDAQGHRAAQGSGEARKAVEGLGRAVHGRPMPQDDCETDQRCRIRDNLYCKAETRQLL